MGFPACHLCQISQKKLPRKPLNLKGLGRGGPNLLTLRLSPRRLEQLCRERSELCLLQTEGDSSLLKPGNHIKVYIGVGGWSGRVLCPGLTLDCEGEGRRNRWNWGSPGSDSCGIGPGFPQEHTPPPFSFITLIYLLFW